MIKLAASDTPHWMREYKLYNIELAYTFIDQYEHKRKSWLQAIADQDLADGTHFDGLDDLVQGTEEILRSLNDWIEQGKFVSNERCRGMSHTIDYDRYNTDRMNRNITELADLERLKASPLCTDEKKKRIEANQNTLRRKLDNNPVYVKTHPIRWPTPRKQRHNNKNGETDGSASEVGAVQVGTKEIPE